MKTVRIAGIALKWLFCDKEATCERVEKLIREAAANGARIVATSECFLDGYLGGDGLLPRKMTLELAEPVPGGVYCRRLAVLAGELKINLAAGLTERDGERMFVSAVLFGPEGEHVGTYRKEKLAPCDRHRRTPGDGPAVFDSPYGRIGFRICYDRTHPDVVKATFDAGADFLVILSGGVYGENNTRMVCSRARENKRHVIFTHPVHFFAVNPDGSVLAEAQFGGKGAQEDAKNCVHDLVNVHGIKRGMCIGTEQIGTEPDTNGVGYCEIPVRGKG